MDENTGAESEVNEVESQEGDTPDLDPGLYPGIDKVPQQYRQFLDPILKEVNTNANKRISEVNEKLNAWKPYEELGVRDNIDPETMQDVMGLLEIMGQVEDDPTHFKEWWQRVGSEYDFFEDNGGEEEVTDPLDEDFLTEDSLKEMIANEMKDAISPFLQQQQEAEQQKLLASADKQLDQEIQALKDEHGDFDDEIESRICKLALAYGDEEGAIKKGFEDYKSIVEDAEGKLFSKKADQPDKPEGPGTPNTNPEKITSFQDAAKLAKERLAQGS